MTPLSWSQRAAVKKFYEGVEQLPIRNSLSDNTYKSFTYSQLGSGKSYQIAIATLDGKDVCIRPYRVEQKKCS
jgi:hypothetical protein